MQNSRFRSRLFSTFVLGAALLASPGAWAQAIDTEPNQTCGTAQDLSTATYPFTLQGSLDTPPQTPDVDYYRFTGEPGTVAVIQVDGASAGGGTLLYPIISVVDRSCHFLGYADSYLVTSPRVEVLVPYDGVFIVGVSSSGDWGYAGYGSYAGSYRLTVSSLATARSIGGRIVNAETGAPVPYASVVLTRREPDGSQAWLGGTEADAQGAFRFENGSYYVYSALIEGEYWLNIYADGYETNPNGLIKAGPFVLTAGQDLDVGALGLKPLPSVGSVRGRLVDEITGAPLSGVAAPFASVQLQSCRPWCYPIREERVAADGTFRFDSTFDNRLEPGTYQIVGRADQYQVTYSEDIELVDDQHFDIGDFKVKSMPARIELVQGCGGLPATGGTCRFSMRVTNGSLTRMEGKAWSVVHGSWTGTPAQQTQFQVESPRTLSLAPGESVVLPLSFEVPGALTNGAYICAQGFAAQKPNEFNTLGQQYLFCFNKGIAGYSLVPEAEKHDALRRALGQAGPRQP